MERQHELRLNLRQPDQGLETRSVRSWRGISVQYCQLQLPTEYEFKWDGHCHYLAHHDLVLADGEMEVRGERPIAGGDLRDQMTYVPAGQTIDGWARPADRINAFTVVCFDPAAMTEELLSEFNGSEPRPHIYFKDNELGSTMRKLGRLMADHERPISNIYTEALCLTAALEMVKIMQPETLKTPAAGRLSKAQERLVQDYIEDNLAVDIGLDELASICGLTRFHFSRAFKATFGEPPYQYVIRRRIEKAKQMLAATRLPIAAVAAACGFNGASQFGRSFRDTVGQTPLEFRRNS